MKMFFGFVSLAASAALVSAQAPTAIYEWQASSDNGLTWSNDCNGDSVKVRLLAYWTGIPDAVGVGFAGGQFDAVLLGTGPIGTVSNIAVPPPFNFLNQNLVASSYFDGKKIDTTSDVFAPGVGIGWINPAQTSYDTNPSVFNSANGAVIFTYDVSNAGIFEVSMVLNPTVGRAMALYTNAAGVQQRINASATTVILARINVPTPGSIVLPCLAALAAARRRR